MARARDEMVDFYRMNEAELQDWVEFNAGRVNDGDRYGNTALYATVYKNYPSLVLWLLNEKGADLSATTSANPNILQVTKSLDILNTLLDHGADPTWLNDDGHSPLYSHVFLRPFDTAARLLEDPRVRAVVSVQSKHGDTVFHYACIGLAEALQVAIFKLFLRAGVSPALTDKEGKTPLD